MKRILIIGVSASGKSTLASKLASHIGGEFLDLDEIFWKPGWIQSSQEVFRCAVEKALKAPCWVVSGNYSSVQPMILKEVDTIIWLDYSWALVLWRALTRTLKRAIFKTPCCNGNYESIRLSFFSKDSILLWVLKTYTRRKRQYSELEQVSDKPFYRIKKPKDLEIIWEQ